MTTDVKEALRLSPTALDELFGDSPAGAIPHGKGSGTAVAAPASRLAAPFARAASVFWRGKGFDPVNDELLNLLTRFEFRAFKAAVREEPSLVDGRPCIVLDYSKTSLVARWIRDEIRQVGPDDYLGLVFIRNRKVPLRFWLHFSPAA